MTRKFTTLAALVVAAVSTAACSNNAAAPATNAAAVAKSATAGAEDPSTVVATVNGEKITLADLDKPMTGKLRSMEQEMRDQKHKMRQAGLEAMVAKKLVEAEAKKKGVTEEELLKAEVESKITPPTEAEIKAFYDQQSASGQPLPPYEQVKDRIAQYLTGDQQRKVMIAYFDQLKAAAKVEINLPEPVQPKVEVAATGPSKGPENAPVTIVAFSDFECPFCSRVNPTIEQVMKEYDGKVKFVFRDYPLPFHAKAPKASEAAHCAEEQGKFWEMHDVLFANQKALEVTDLKKHAGTIAGIDQAKFDACLDSDKHAETVKKNMEAGEEAGVQGTPAFFVNGTPLSGALPFEEFKKVIDSELGLGATASK
ncbi:thioredoxin domain-containing protein [Vulgatibacter sp.]|uniref:thioredoxin domain-containing protein n=1 Tax=Vulgatibacter sp. TaxID=1971226 RepID=UPI00356A5AEB